MSIRNALLRFHRARPFRITNEPSETCSLGGQSKSYPLYACCAVLHLVAFIAHCSVSSAIKALRATLFLREMPNSQFIQEQSLGVGFDQLTVLDHIQHVQHPKRLLFIFLLCLCLSLSVCLSVCLSLSLSLCLCLSVCLSVSLSLSLSLSLRFVSLV